MPDLVMLVGLPASGKSTFRTEFVENNPHYVVISSDDYIDARAFEEGMTYSEAFDRFVKDADIHCRKIFADAVAKGSNILIDRTNLTAKVRRSFLSSLPKKYVRNAHIFFVPDDILDERLEMRAKATGKHIPANIVKNMRGSYEAPTLVEFDAIWSHNSHAKYLGTRTDAELEAALYELR